MNYGVLLDRAKKEMPYQKPMRETFTPDRQVDWKGLIPIIKELKENKGYPYTKISLWIHKVSGLKLSPQTLRFRCLHFDLTEIKRRNK